MEGKTVLITGANSGAGKETARILAKQGARIIMACRNMETANTARDEIVNETGNNNVIVKKIDLSEQKSIREFSEDILRTERRLDVLIHNAGMALFLKRAQTKDGIEMTMAVNYYGPFLLTHLLIDLLKQSSPSRIIIVSSKMYIFSTVNPNNMNPIGMFPPLHAYSVSKRAVIHFTLELARRLRGTGVTANCLHPGIFLSGILRTYPVPISCLLNSCIWACGTTSENGGKTSAYLALSPEVEGVTGKYFIDSREHPLTASVQDMERAKQIWEASFKYINFQNGDPII